MALLAMLLMVAAPSISRSIASNNADSGSGWVEMCTMTGLKLVSLADFGKSEVPKPMPMGQDCAYCPLSASIAPLLLLVALIFTLVTQSTVAAVTQTILRGYFYPSGLGSRGPPILL